MEIGKIKDYFEQDTQYQQSLTTKLGKYLAVFDYTNKILTVILTFFSSTNPFAHVKTDKKLVGLITSVSSLIIFLLFGVAIKLKEETKLRKKKHDRLLYLAKNKLDYVEMLISNSTKDGVIDHDEFLDIIGEKKSMILRKVKVIKSRLRLFKKDKNCKFFLFIITMVFVTSEVFAEDCIYTIKQIKMNIKNINDSVGKEIKNKFKDKPTEKQLKVCVLFMHVKML